MGYHIRLALSFLLFMPLFVTMAAGNPIPIYPDPEPAFYGPSGVSSLHGTWIASAFVTDFFINILIVYGGIYVLHHYNLISIKNVFDFSRTKLLLSVFLISLVGLLSELFLGAWIGGLLLALVFIFLSFVFVSIYLLKFSWPNGLRMGFIALVINIITWIVVFTL
ncbi:MAG: hypothetical protein JSW60_01610 [Thermoplasmatales archaeon]|nr:MAG: hypothetical protein JSW60_01610 [Thermoplasmatales archaeon]